MEGITSSNKTNHNRNTNSFLSELILNSFRHNNPIAHFEWDKELNIISYNDLAHSVLILSDETKPLNRISDVVPPKYLNALNTHITELQTSEHHLSTFSYEIPAYGIDINITWLSILDDKKITTICCHVQTNALGEDSLSTLLKVIPTPALVMGQDGQYIGCNSLMLRIMDLPPNVTLETLIGNTIGSMGENPTLCKYIRTALSLARPNLIREIQTTFTLSTGNKVYYLFSYCKHNSSTILIGLDITDVKRLEIDLLAAEERNAAILKALPDVMKASALRRKDNKMDILINQLTKDPIFTSIPGFDRLKELDTKPSDTANDKELYPKLIRLEVELREINVRLKQVETIMFLEDSGLINRLKHAEVFTTTISDRVNTLTQDVQKVDTDLEMIRMTKRLINVTPGGSKMLITSALVGLTLLIFGIHYLMDNVGLKKTIDNIRNPSSLTK